MRRISLETNMMITKYMSNTKITIETETQKISQQVAQTALDLVGIKTNYILWIWTFRLREKWQHPPPDT